MDGPKWALSHGDTTVFARTSKLHANTTCVARTSPSTVPSPVRSLPWQRVILSILVPSKHQHVMNIGR